MSKPQLETLSVTLQLDMLRYQATLDADNALDTRNGVLLAATLALIAYVFPVDLSTQAHGCLCLLQSALVIGGITAILGLLLTAIAIWPRRYSLPNHLARQRPDYLDMQPIAITKQYISDLEDAIMNVETQQVLKVKFFQKSFILFIISTILLLPIKLFI